MAPVASQPAAGMRKDFTGTKTLRNDARNCQERLFHIQFNRRPGATTQTVREHGKEEQRRIVLNWEWNYEAAPAFFGHSLVTSFTPSSTSAPATTPKTPSSNVGAIAPAKPPQLLAVASMK